MKQAKLLAGVLAGVIALGSIPLSAFPSEEETELIVASAEDEILYEEDISVPEAEETNTEENNTEEIAVTDDEEVLDWDSLIEDADDLVEEQISENAIWGFRSWDEEEWASKYADRFTTRILMGLPGIVSDLWKLL